MDVKKVGDELFRQSNWQAAREHYQRAATADPQLITALANSVACSIHLKDWHVGLADCEAALKVVSGALRVKVLWRKAVCLRNIGESKNQWDEAVAEGLRLDPANATLQDEATYLFVTNVNSFPIFSTEMHNTTRNQETYNNVNSHSGKEVTENVKNSHRGNEMDVDTTNTRGNNTTFIEPSLPLGYNGLLTLVRAGDAAYRFWYAHVRGSDLQQALKVGVEPDVLEYMLQMMKAHPTQTERNEEFMAALRASPRYEMAALMV